MGLLRWLKGKRQTQEPAPRPLITDPGRSHLPQGAERQGAASRWTSLHHRQGEKKRQKKKRETRRTGRASLRVGWDGDVLASVSSREIRGNKAITAEKVRAEDTLRRLTQGNRMLARRWLEWALRPRSPPDPEKPPDCLQPHCSLSSWEHPHPTPLLSHTFQSTATAASGNSSL